MALQPFLRRFVNDTIYAILSYSEFTSKLECIITYYIFYLQFNRPVFRLIFFAFTLLPTHYKMDSQL